MAKQQKGMQQESVVPSAVVVNDHYYVSPSPTISFFHDPFWVKNDIQGQGYI